MADRLQVLIQVPSEDLDFIVEYEKVTDSISAESNKNPSPVGRQVTSSRSVNDDILRLRGWIRTLSCGGVRIDETDILPKLKRVLVSQNYTSAEYATITTPHAVRTNMELMTADVDTSYKRPQELIISMVWKSANFSGDTEAPNFSIGGVR